MNPRLPYLREKTRRLTDSPGVYLMKDSSGGIIYVGKAKNLKNRVTSYFRQTPDHTPKVAKMVSHVYDYDFIVTDSEYEALVLECSLIKQYSPKYNILLKDDKGYYYIKISDGAYPKITAEMQKTSDGTHLGPYTSGYTVKQAVNEANRVFMLPTCHKEFPRDFKKGRPCLNFHIEQCMGVCQGKISSAEYNETIRQAVDYMKTGSTASVERMTAEMEAAAEEMDFERAAKLRDRIKAIVKAADTQKIITGMKDTDVIAMALMGEYSCVSVLLYRGGRLQDKSVYFLGEDEYGDESFSSFLTQYYQGRKDIPKEILIEREVPDKLLLEELLRNQCGHAVTVTVPQRGNPLKLISLAKENAGEYLSFRAGRTAKEIVALEELAKVLGLSEPPEYIEAYDISNLASSAMVAGMVVFYQGRPLKNAYKRFSIRETAIQNDYASMQEVLGRRFQDYKDQKDGFTRLPDLILLDGGKGQVNAVLPVLEELGISVPVFGMVKDNKHRTRAIATSGEEIAVSDLKPAFFLLTRIQDEVHRYSVSYQRKKHAKTSYSLELTNIKGIGEKKALKLISKYKTKSALKEASLEDLAKTAGVNEEIAGELYRLIHEIY